MPKKRYFVLVSHCLLNPATRVHILGRRFHVAKLVCEYFLSKNIAIIQLPCPEFTAMGYWRNPQGRQQYDNVFFKKYCREQLSIYVDMVCELKNNNNTPLCYIGIQGSPNCSIYWGKHKTNKYNTESIVEDTSKKNEKAISKRKRNNVSGVSNNNSDIINLSRNNNRNINRREWLVYTSTTSKRQNIRSTEK